MACVNCGTTENLQTHHTTYNPPITILLCTECHQKCHPAHGVGCAHWFKKFIPENFADIWKNKPYPEIMMMFGISNTTVYNWAKKLGLSNKPNNRYAFWVKRSNPFEKNRRMTILVDEDNWQHYEKLKKQLSDQGEGELSFTSYVDVCLSISNLSVDELVEKLRVRKRRRGSA